MKLTLIALTFVFSSLAFAESHGGVARSNAQFKAVTEYALNEGGSLYRVLNVSKLKNTDSFVISYGGMDSKTGKESTEYKEVVEATLIPDASGVIDETSEVKITKK